MKAHRKFRVRLKVHLGKALTSDEISLVAHVNGRDVEIKSQVKTETLRNAKWIILSSGELDSEEEAWKFGEQLKDIVTIVGICSRIGIDVGEDLSTGSVNETWAREIGLIKPEERLHPNIHGLSVIPDDGLSRFLTGNVSGTVTYSSEAFVAAINELGQRKLPEIEAHIPSLRILNLAIKSLEPLTQIVLAISVIESMGQDEAWSKKQRQMLETIAIEFEASEDLEKKEIADALRRSLHRIGLRQGVLRVLTRLGLEHLRKDWDKLYAIRSNVFHGTRRLTDTEAHELAQSAITLCGQVVIAILSQHGAEIPTVAKQNFPSNSAK